MPVTNQVTEVNFTVADALRQHAPAFLEKYKDKLPVQHQKVLTAITRCGTGELGHAVYLCQKCGRQHWVGRSCGNRHCPGCQKHKTKNWLDKQTAKLLPVQHFVVTFTVPKELRLLLRYNRRAGYNAIFQAGSQAIKTLLKNTRNLGSDKTGFFGVLHTWGRDLKDYHPHVHFVVAGGGVSRNGSKWKQVKPGQLFHPQPAKMLYKKLFVEQLRKAGLYGKLPFGVLKLNWVVNIKPVGSGEAVLKYLAPYVYRVAISDRRIKNVNQHAVEYQIKPSGKQRFIKRVVSGEAFVRSFALHILPSGFQKIRYYGFMSPNCKVQLANVRWLVWLWKGWTYWLGSAMFRPNLDHPKPSCHDCGGELKLLALTNQHGRIIWRPPSSPHKERAPP